MSDHQPIQSQPPKTETNTGKEVKAYKAFKQTTRHIIHTFTEQAGSFIAAIDQKRAEEIEKKIQAS